MGTRADFYVGRGAEAEWLGSIAWDGHPGSIFTTGDIDLPPAVDELVWRELVAEYLARREDATLPEQGWPWPWENSRTTDYAYAFEGGDIYGSSFGHEWFDVREPEPEDDSGVKVAVFPDMTAHQNVKFGGPGSGLIVVSAPS